MKEIEFVLNTKDIEIITQSLDAFGSGRVDLIAMFSVLALQDKDVYVATVEEEPQPADISDLLDDLDLELAEPLTDENLGDFEDDKLVAFDSGPVPERDLPLDPKIQVMVQDPTPVATPIETPINATPPKVAEEDDDFITEYDAHPAGVNTGYAPHGKTGPHVPDETAPETPAETVPVKEEVEPPAGWDPRVPFPKPDAQYQQAVGTAQQPKPTFNPQPNNEPPAAPPETKKVEPDFDRDETCVGCGGFLSVNPHTDPKMNCDCGEDPYEVDTSEDETFGSPHGRNIPTEPPQEQENKTPTSQQPSPAPSGAWTTVPARQEPSGNVWHT